MMGIAKITDYLEPAQHQHLLNTVSDGRFPWYWNDSVTYAEDQCGLDDFQFVHTLYVDFSPSSEYFSLMLPILERLKPAALIRVKLNLNPRTAEPVKFQLHRDVSDTDCATAIYYLNSNNGWTEFETGEKIPSVANQMVMFPGPLLHTGTTSTDQKRRLILNINYIP